MQEDPLKVLPQAVRDVPQIISGELAQPFQGSLIARIFLLNPAGLPVTLNLDHNLRLAKLWVSPIYSKLNPPLYVGENRVLFPSCPNPNWVYLLWKQSWFPLLSWGWWRRLGVAPSKNVTDSSCSYLNLQKFFKNKCFSECCVALIDFRCDGIVVFVNVF